MLPSYSGGIFVVIGEQRGSFGEPHRTDRAPRSHGFFVFVTLFPAQHVTVDVLVSAARVSLCSGDLLANQALLPPRLWCLNVHTRWQCVRSGLSNWRFNLEMSPFFEILKPIFKHLAL